MLNLGPGMLQNCTYLYLGDQPLEPPVFCQLRSIIEVLNEEVETSVAETVRFVASLEGSLYYLELARDKLVNLINVVKEIGDYSDADLIGNLRQGIRVLGRYTTRYR